VLVNSGIEPWQIVVSVTACIRATPAREFWFLADPSTASVINLALAF
jgi:hypothetical protein